MKKVSRFLIFVLAFVLLISVITGCTSNTTTTATTAGGTTKATTAAATTTAATTTAAEEVVDITALITESATEYLKADSNTYKKLQEILLTNFNINYTITTALSTEMKTTVNMLFASGEMPDIVDFGLSSAEFSSLFEQGLILRLNELIDEFAPNVKATFEENPLFYIAHGDIEGNILRIPSNFTFNPQHRITMLHINLTWLETLNLELPETTEDFYQALKAFQENDMNKDGDKNEVFTAYNTASIGRPLAPAFGAKNWSSAIASYYYDGGGKVYHEMVQPSAKEFLTYMNMLYEEGLLDNDYAGQTSETYNEKMYTGKIAAVPDSFWGSSTISAAIRANGFENEEFYQVPPLVTDINNAKAVYRADGTGYGGWMITSNCKNPEKAILIANYGYSPEGSQIVYYGEAAPGGKYYRVKTAEEIAAVGVEPPAYFMDYTDEGKKRSEDETRDVFWTKEGFNAFIIPFQLVAKDANAIVWSNFPNRGKYKFAEADHIIDVLNKGNGEYAIDAVRFMTPTSEQNAVLEEKAELFVYMDEMVDKFISGVEPLANWDAYVAKCTEMGLEDVLEVMQARYDAYLDLVG